MTMRPQAHCFVTKGKFWHAASTNTREKTCKNTTCGGLGTNPVNACKISMHMAHCTTINGCAATSHTPINPFSTDPWKLYVSHTLSNAKNNA
jgi:hypothetical protein